jgi:hypothetical protein
MRWPGFVLVLLLSAACAPATASRPPVVLTPTTPLGTIALAISAAPTVTVELSPDRARGADVAAARSAVARAIADADLGRALAERTLRLARARTSETFVVAPAGSAGAPRGADTLFELTLTEVTLAAPKAAAPDPPLTLVLAGRLRLVRVADGVELLARRVNYTAETRSLGAWIAEGARVLRGALDPALEALAALVVDEVF